MITVMTTVFVNGCFDGLHMGHLWFLGQASLYGDRLVVGLNTDSSIKRLKGPERPFYNQIERAWGLEKIPCVDAVYFFDEDTPVELIKRLRPDVLIKGWDCQMPCPEASLVHSWGHRVSYLPRYGTFSTTEMLRCTP